jgi:hypothetical protein
MWPGPKGVDVSYQPIAVYNHIIIGPQDIIAFCSFDRTIASIGMSLSFFMQQTNWQSISKLPDDLVCIIGAIIVDNKHFPIDIRWDCELLQT